jgi:hypothetical protein
MATPGEVQLQLAPANQEQPLTAANLAALEDGNGRTLRNYPLLELSEGRESDEPDVMRCCCIECDCVCCRGFLWPLGFVTLLFAYTICLPCTVLCSQHCRWRKPSRSHS